MGLFRLRQALNVYAEVNPAWETLTALYYQKALLNERGGTEQEQCILQGIRLAVWYSGQIPAPWTKAFPLPYVKPEARLTTTLWQRLRGWYRQCQDAWRRFRSK